MNSSIQISNNSEFSIRTVNDNNEIWFVAKDVAQALEYSEASLNQVNNLFANVPDIWKGHKRIMVTSDKPTARPYQDVLCLTEQGLYFFLGRSDKPKALPYQLWIAGDVVPSIRQTGSYSMKNNRELDIEVEKEKIKNERIGFLQHMLDNPHNYPLTDVSKTIIAHEVYKLITGSECLAMLPEATEARYSATEIGKMFGVSSNKIGRIAKNYGLKSKQGESNEFGTWICTKSQNSNHECLSFVYNDKAIAWFREHFNRL